MASAIDVNEVVVWEFENDVKGLYSPYSDRVSNALEDEYRKDKNGVAALGDSEPLLKDYEVQFQQMIQVNAQGSSHINVRRKFYRNDTVIGNGIVWEWLTDIGWVTYDKESIDAIEDAYSKNIKELDLGKLRFRLPNVVLIEKGYQMNKKSKFIRPVQRRAAAYTSNTPTKRQKKEHVMSSLSATNSLDIHSFINAVPRIIPAPLSLMGEHDPQVEIACNPSASDVSTPINNSHISKFCTVVTDLTSEKDICSICLCSLLDEEDESVKDQVVQLQKCKHRFHESCMEAYCKQTQHDGCVQCPVCKRIHGVKRGTQPPGTMKHSIDKNQSVVGYSGCGMITITYDIRPGIQGPKHPSPGSHYNTQGFPRTCYLPANEKGLKVLKLLKIAWQRDLIFTVGTSSTTGQNNCVIWNDIHHKTSAKSNSCGHGYPDPSYLDNVLEELKLHGVEDD